MKPISPAARLSLSLALITVSVLMVGDFLRLVPDYQTHSFVEARKKLCEALAIQFATALDQNGYSIIESTMRGMVERNPDVLSTSLRNADGSVLIEAGDHQRYWKQVEGDRWTPRHALVPILKAGRRWGTLEVSFTPIYPKGILGLHMDPMYSLALYLGMASFLAFLFFMRRTLRHLDPSSVVPTRVQSALDALAEGLAFTDGQEQIVLANSAFENAVGQPKTRLLGRKLSEFDWTRPDSDDPVFTPPWTGTLEHGRRESGETLMLHPDEGPPRSFSVNSSPVTDDDGKVRGAIVTFDEITHVEEQNQRLGDALSMLRAAEAEARKSNERLEILALRDPLTGCLNRRALFDSLEKEVANAKRDGEQLSCVMADIDHFKSVNDRFGHQTGDQVIQYVVGMVTQGLRSTDLVARYGGEEFCILLPGLDSAAAHDVADEIRRSIATKSSAVLRFSDGGGVTSSFGVASVRDDIMQGSQLLQRADQALYWSKTNGRNRVSRWDDIEQLPAATG